MTATFAGTIPCPACGLALPPDSSGLTRCSCGVESRVFRFRPFRRVGPAPITLDVPCAYHAGNPASFTCARCGSFLCRLCETPVEGMTYCTACFERVRETGAHASLRNQFPRPHATAFAFSALACLIFPLAPLIVPLAVVRIVRALRERGEIVEREGRCTRHLVAAVGLSFAAVGFSLAFYVGLVTAAGAG